MLQLRKTLQLGAALAQNLRKTTDAVRFRMAEKNPFRAGRARRDAPKTNSDVLAEFLCRQKPRTNRIRLFSAITTSSN